jgi:integrase
MARRRRGRGEGGIYQRPDGLWSANFSFGCDGRGKRKRKVIYGSSKKEVQGKLDELRATGGDEPVKDTVEQYLARWLSIVKTKVEPATFGPYERHCRLHIVPHIGTIKLAKLEPVHVQQLYSTLAAAKVSAALQRKVGTTLSVALGEAVRLNLRKDNPARNVRKPKAAKPDIQVLDPDQVAKFLDEASKDRLAAYYVTALDSGCRPGELFALTWPDVDFERGQISVTKSLEDIDGHLRVKDVKTKRGRRRIDLSPFCMTELNRHRARMLAEGRDVKTGIVFVDTTGGYLRNGNLRANSFKPILERAGLPDITLYSLRHTCATLLLLADENVKVISERLGHATIQLTLDTYSHVLPTMQKRAASKMDRILGRKPEREATA